MNYLVLIALFTISTLSAYHLLKVNVAYYLKLIFNIILLIISACILVATNISETSLLIYMLILIMTSLGILLHFIVPIVLNGIGIVLSKIQGEHYVSLRYDELMRSGHRMYFCVLAFLTLKVVLYIILCASFIGII